MTEQTTLKTPKERSPSYPIISLKVALERLELFENMFGRHPAPFKKVGMAWKIKEGSSQANQVLAALKAFGLIEYEGSGNDRKAVISESGRKYLHAQQEEIKREVIRKAALKPKAIAKFWPIWGADRPPDALCLDTLVFEYKFNKNAAPTFLRVYDETISFAGLDDSDKFPDTDEGEEPEDCDDSDGRSAPPRTPLPESLPSGKLKNPKGIKIMEGERELITGPLSKAAGFRLIVNGQIGLKEIERLIAKLELEKDILSEPDEPNEDPVTDETEN